MCSRDRTNHWPRRKARLGCKRTPLARSVTQGGVQVLRDLHLYDLVVLSFAQLAIFTLLLLSPAREIGARFRWTGSRITEVLVSSSGAVGLCALSCFLVAELTGLPASGLEDAAYILSIFLIVAIALRSDCGIVGQAFHASYLAAWFAFGAFAEAIAISASHSIAENVLSSFLLVLNVVAFLVWGSNMNYVSDVLCRSRHSRVEPRADPAYLPMVSLHIPAYNEPPELLIRTIMAAEQIDYPNFEVVVVDNNTADPSIWGPVEEYCRDRERVRFVHVAPWPGYKAGACNLALRRYTDPRAEIIGLIDADDIVQPHYLRETVPYFADRELGFLQTFEGNRDFEGSTYYQACVDSYQGFYLAVMSSRNERDSVPFVGTMGLFRRSALEGIGGWNEWCISEDTEASLRMSKAGWAGLYIPRCFGRGIVPPTFAGLNTQRHRWCFGAMQIFRLHWRSLMPWDRSPDNHLTPSQRRDYFMACMSWTRDLLLFVYALVVLAIASLWLAGSDFTVVPLAGNKSLLALSLILIATLCMMWTLRNWTAMSRRRALLSLLISFSATWVTALACMEGLVRRDGVFLRTSKTGGRHRRLRTAIRASRYEAVLAAALYAAAGFLAAARRPPWLLIFVIAVQATVYLCAPVASLWNLRVQRVHALTYRRRFEERGLRLANRRRGLGRVLGPAIATALALGVGGIASAFVAPVDLMHTNGLLKRAPLPRSLLNSPRTSQVFVSLGTSRSPEARFFPVSSVQLFQLASYSSRTTQLGLRFGTSSLALLSEVLHTSTGKPPTLTVVIREPKGPENRAATEWAGTFSEARVSSFDEKVSKSVFGTVTLMLSGPDRLLVAPKSNTGVETFPKASPSPRAPIFKVYLGVTSSRKHFTYSVSSLQLSQMATSLGARKSFVISFKTTSQRLLNDVVAASRRGKSLSRLTVEVRESGARATTSEWVGAFSKAAVTSFEEDVAGPPGGQVTISLR